MSTLVKIAWLNLWRNPHRTAILLVSMTIGLVGVILSIGFINGWIEGMREASVQNFEGHVKIYGKGFHQNPIIEHARPQRDAGYANDPRVRGVADRIALQALIATAAHSRMVRLVGFDPEREGSVSTIPGALREGVLPTTKNQVLIGRPLADKLKTRIGKKLVLTAQQANGEIGAGAFRVTGIYDTGANLFDELHVYLPLAEAQALLGMTNRVTETVVVLKDITDSADFAKDIAATLDPARFEVLSWEERMPLVTESMKMTDQSMWIYYVVFFSAMAFGIVNTLLMAIGERTRELGVMLAIGMQRRRLAGLFLLESCFLALTAAVLGVLVGAGLIAWFQAHPIDLSGVAAGADYMGMGRELRTIAGPRDFLNAVLATVGITVLFSVYPAVKAARIVPVEALRAV